MEELSEVNGRRVLAQQKGAYPFSAISDLGRVRLRNEDTFHIDAKRGLFLLADGMGGHPSGDLAARLAVEVASSYLTAKSVPGRPRQRAEKLAYSIGASNQAILQASESEQSLYGMGTTMVGLWIGKRDVHVCHVGDSRAYRIKGDSIEQITRDHTVVQELIDRGDLDADSPEVKRIGHILTQAVGLEVEVVPSVRTVRRRTDDVYLLCSDGLSDMIGQADIAKIVAEANGNLSGGADALVEAALDAGGTDNVTVILVKPSPDKK